MQILKEGTYTVDLPEAKTEDELRLLQIYRSVPEECRGFLITRLEATANMFRRNRDEKD